MLREVKIHSDRQHPRYGHPLRRAREQLGLEHCDKSRDWPEAVHRSILHDCGRIRDEPGLTLINMLQ